MLATNDIFWISALMFAGLMLFVWFARPERAGAKGAGAVVAGEQLTKGYFVPGSQSSSDCL